MAHPIRAGQDMSSPECTATVHTSAHTPPSPNAHTPGNRATSTAGTWPAPPVQLSRAHIRAHRRQGCTSSALPCLPGRAHTLKHLCKYTGMHTHTHLCETTPMCKSNLGTCTSPVLLLHPALSMQILPVQTCATEIPSPGPKVPRAVPLAMQGFGEQHYPEQTATPLCASPHASLEQPLVPALALTRSGCLMSLALPVMRRSPPLGANPARELFPR